MIYGPLSTEYFDLVKPQAFPEEIDFYQEILKETQEPILYAMCGSGRLLLPLLKLGFNIEGLDYSKSMLERCYKQGVEQGLLPVLHQQSVDNMSLQKKYGTILIVGGSFQMIYPREKAVQALQVAKDHLLKGGRLLIDTFVPWELLYENGEKEQFTHEVQGTDGSKIKLSSFTQANKELQYFISYNHYEKIKGGKVVASESEEMPVLWYYFYEIQLLIKSVGFTEVKAHNKKLGQHPELCVLECVL